MGTERFEHPKVHAVDGVGIGTKVVVGRCRMSQRFEVWLVYLGEELIVGDGETIAAALESGGATLDKLAAAVRNAPCGQQFAARARKRNG